MDVREVNIPVFLHPHLFWLFETKNILERHQLQCELATEYQHVVEYDKEFVVGEIVALKRDNLWNRGIIEEVIEDGSFKYEIWLMDYGYLCHTDLVYKLHKKYKVKPALVKQASLYNVVFLDEGFSLERSCIDKIKNSYPNAGATFVALEFLKDYTLFFEKKKEVNGILFGDILYKRNGLTSSLTKTMIDKNLMVQDEGLFSKVEESRIYDKDFHIPTLREASKNHKLVRVKLDFSILMDEIFTRTSPRGISLGGGYMTPDSKEQNKETLISPGCDTMSEKTKPSKSEMLKKLKRKSHPIGKERLEFTDSELVKPIEEGTISPKINEMEISCETSMNKSSKLKNLVSRKKQNVVNSGNSDTENTRITSAAESDYSVVIEQPKANKKFLALKLRNAKRHQGNNDLQSESDASLSLKSPENNKIMSDGYQLDETPKPPKILTGMNSLFLPGGIRTMNRPSAKKKSSTSYFSDSSVSMEQKRPKMIPRNTSSLNSTSDVTDVDQKETNNKKKTSNSESYEKQKNTNSDTISEVTDIDQTEGNEEREIAQPGPDSNVPTSSDLLAPTSKMVIKPICNCRNCHHWTTCDEWKTGAENFSEECTKTQLKIVRPHSLLLQGKRDDNVHLSSVNYRAMTKLQKQASYKVLVHGKILPVPIDRVPEAPFHPMIHSRLKNLGYTRAKKIQTYVWPAIIRSLNVCYVHRQKTGKTLAYLPPLCSFLLDRHDRYSEFKKGGGPIVTILCSSSTQCEEIYDLAHLLMENTGSKKPKVLIVSYPFDHINMSSVDLLITIPTVLVELFKKNATNMKRLCHLVFEDSSVLLDKFSKEVEAIIDVVESMLTHRIVKRDVQMIMSSCHWTLQLENFAKKLREIPLVVIGDYLEAGIYGRIKLKLKCIDAKAKRDAVVDILRDKWKFFKSIILCNTNEEADVLRSSLDLESMSCICITDELSKEDIMQQEMNWELLGGGDYKVLICTDQVMHTMLSITSASLLINYSLPEKWTLLTRRFNCLLENYKSPLVTNNNKLLCEAYILTDELCEKQIPKLLSLLKNYNVPLNQFEPYCKQIELEKEEIKVSKKTPLCQWLKQFGCCQNADCVKRHILSPDLDCDSPVPKNGTIKFKIVEICDVNRFLIKIVEHKDIEGRSTKMSSNDALDDQELTSLLSETKKKAEEICKGESYAFWDSEEFDDTFRRCVVEEDKGDVVKILLSEKNQKIMACKSKLFELPEKFKTSETDAPTELIVVNFKPPYKDEKFSARAFLRLKISLENIVQDNNLFVANICLQLGNTLWVNNVSEEVNVFELNLYKSNLTKQLVKQKLAEPNPEHLKALYALCEEAEIVLPKYDIPITRFGSFEETQVAPQWAFLDAMECNQVIFSSAVSPAEFYVRLEKFHSLLANLEKDIEDVVRRQGSKRDYAIIAGRYYLARDREENKFARVFIKQIENGEALCFSVDHGDEYVVKLEDIRFLSNHLITKLPFQAIQCRLHGLKAIDDEWPAEAVDVLYDKFTFETDSNVYRTLYAKAIYSNEGNFPEQLKFSILLKDVYEKPIIINQLLVDCGWADLIPGVVLNDFDIPIRKYDSEDESLVKDDDFREMRDIYEAVEMIESNNLRTSNDYSNDPMEIEYYFGEPDEEKDQFFSFMDAVMKAAEEKRASAGQTSAPALPAIEAAPFEVDYCTPDIVWSQTKKTVDMYIKIPCVETYKIHVQKSRIFSFQTKVNDKKYAINIMLYEMVEKEFTHNLGGLEIKVTLTKKEQVEWPKLSRSKKRLRNVHYMLSKEEMEDEKKKLFLDLGEDFKSAPTCNDSDEDAPMYIEVSDLESEFDMDLEDDSDS